MSEVGIRTGNVQSRVHNGHIVLTHCGETGKKLLSLLVREPDRIVDEISVLIPLRKDAVSTYSSSRTVPKDLHVVDIGPLGGKESVHRARNQIESPYNCLQRNVEIAV